MVRHEKKRKKVVSRKKLRGAKTAEFFENPSAPPPLPGSNSFVDRERRNLKPSSKVDKPTTAKSHTLDLQQSRQHLEENAEVLIQASYESDHEYRRKILSDHGYAMMDELTKKNHIVAVNRVTGQGVIIFRGSTNLSDWQFNISHAAERTQESLEYLTKYADRSARALGGLSLVLPQASAITGALVSFSGASRIAQRGLDTIKDTHLTQRRMEKAKKLVKKVQDATGRNDVSAIGHSLGGLLAQSCGATATVLTVNKFSLGGESYNPHQIDYRTDKDLASMLRNKSSRIATKTFAPLTEGVLGAHDYRGVSSVSRKKR